MANILNPPTPTELQDPTRIWGVAPYPTTPTPNVGGVPQYPYNNPTPIPTSIPGGNIRVTSINGYDYEEMYDPKTGTWVNMGMIGRTGAGDQALKDFYFKQWQAGVPNVPGYENVPPYVEQPSPYQRMTLAGQEQDRRQAAATQQYQLQFQQQQLQQEQQQRLATLAANPKSWLEYAATANQPPVIQPWMLPMMSKDYSGAGMPQAGDVIPGWTATNMTGMPDLGNPSAQYWARMGPTAQQQYFGYQQADQAMTPEESQFRLWNTAPPSGFRGFSQVR